MPPLFARVPSRWLFLLAAGFFSTIYAGQRLGAQSARDILIEPSATTSSTSPRIVLDWPEVTNATTGVLYRRVKGTSSWTSRSGLTTTGYTEGMPNSALEGVAYEYSIRINRSVAPSTVYGAIVAGHNIPLVEQRGKVLLVVDNTLADDLEGELNQLRGDLIADGWQVYRLDTPREQVPASSENPADYALRLQERQNLRSAIAGYYNSDPTANWALLLIGHVPVPYSGQIRPDVHPEHEGAWPTDSYYADVDGVWTDNTVHVDANGTAESVNLVGDGKFDQSVLPSNVEFQVGRVDLYNLPSATPAEVKLLPTGNWEAELVRRYLDRNHRFRRGGSYFENVARRMLVDDQLGYFSGEAFAASGYRNGIAMFGRNPGQVDGGSWFGTLQTTPMLFGYACGFGSYVSMLGVANTASFGVYDSKAVFTMLFGSYFGDWDNYDAFLKAPLAGTTGSLGLTSTWSGRGYVHFQHMALGETIGYGVRYTQNNESQTQTGAWYQHANTPFFPDKAIHYGLMGDPTLRLHTVKPVTGLSVQASGGDVLLSWTASPDAASGYHVYRANSPEGPYTRITGVAATGSNPTGSPILTTSYVDPGIPANHTYTYMVKAVRMETTPSGTYANQSLGTVAVPIPGAPDAVTGSVAGEIELTWSPVPDADGYVIERSTSPSDGFTGIAILNAPIVSYTDTFRIANTTYYYRLRARKGYFNSDPGPVDSALPYLPPLIAGWRYVNFMNAENSGTAANDADPDGDSHENIVEYATGGNPNQQTNAPPPLTSGIQDISGTPRLTLTFIHNKAATDLDILVKAADSIDGVPTDIDPFDPGNQVQVLDNVPAAGLETITIKDIQPVAASNERYMRLSVEPSL